MKHALSPGARDSDDDEPQNVLTAARASEFCPKHYRLIAPRRDFTHLHDISSLSSLDYVDLTANKLTSLGGLTHNHNIKTLIVRDNNLSHLTPILKLSALRVLNIAANKFVSTDWLIHASFAAQLLTLVANGNQIKQLEALSCLRAIKTLVLSHNCIEDMTPVTALSSLTKLSLSKNQIRVIPDALGTLRNLAELRLAHNLISSLPTKQALSSLTSLHILDIGHNRISSFEQLAFSGNRIININVRNNPATEKPDFTQAIRQYCPKLEIIDGTRLTGGRRKLRINRLRVAAGFPIEKDRTFARPPPKYALHTLQNDELAQSDGHRARNESNHKHPSVHEREQNSCTHAREHNSISTTKKRKPPTNDAIDEDPDQCLEPSELIAQARATVLATTAAKALPGASLRTHTKGNPKQKRKRRRKGPKAMGVESDFGMGGTSKWK